MNLDSVLGSPSVFTRDAALTLLDLSRDAYHSPGTFAARWGSSGSVFHWDRRGTVAFAVVTDRNIVVVFRGTDEIRDWVSNARVFRYEVLGGKVHSGFHDAWMAVGPMISSAFRGDPRPIWLTGHSLGGAVASIGGPSLDRGGHRVAAVYSFGAPRAGNWKFARSNRGVVHHRVVASSDPVPHMPPWFLGFRHHGSLRFLAGPRVLDHLTLWQWVRSTLGDSAAGWGAHHPRHYAALLLQGNPTMSIIRMQDLDVEDLSLITNNPEPVGADWFVNFDEEESDDDECDNAEPR